MIEARKLHKQFGEVVAVEDVSFIAHDKKITGLLGPNGAGKTTALRMLYSLMRPDSGQALIDGVDPAVDASGARAKLGALPDARGLYPRLSARDNIRYYGELHGMHGSALEARLDELVAVLDLAPLQDRRVAGFSQGERMKVAIARAIIHSPKNIILDEPTNGLDVMSIRSLRRLIRRLREKGCCVLFSSHVMQEVAALCDQIVVVSAGTVVAQGSPDALREQTGCQSLEDAFMRLTNAPIFDDDEELS